jgi:hypothetical protein
MLNSAALCPRTLIPEYIAMLWMVSWSYLQKYGIIRFQCVHAWVALPTRNYSKMISLRCDCNSVFLLGQGNCHFAACMKAQNLRFGHPELMCCFRWRQIFLRTPFPRLIECLNTFMVVEYGVRFYIVVGSQNTRLVVNHPCR